jgi:hypothetical protein
LPALPYTLYSIPYTLYPFKQAFENAITLVMVMGGSTNAVLHLIAMARAVDVDITLDDFQVRLPPCPTPSHPLTHQHTPAYTTTTTVLYFLL